MIANQISFLSKVFCAIQPDEKLQIIVGESVGLGSVQVDMHVGIDTPLLN